MRHKPVPEPPASLDAVETVRAALPRTPRPESDCCARVVDRTDVADRDDAATWLTFLRALGLANEVDGKFVRTDDAVAPGPLADAFEANVYAAREVLDALADADRPLDADAVFERVESVVPRWERERNPDWEATWRERVARLLGWASLLGLVERRQTGYVLPDER